MWVTCFIIDESAEVATSHHVHTPTTHTCHTPHRGSCPRPFCKMKTHSRKIVIIITIIQCFYSPIIVDWLETSDVILLFRAPPVCDARLATPPDNCPKLTPLLNSDSTLVERDALAKSAMAVPWHVSKATT